ncbi:MAG: family efflux transporter permease subunit [Subtercola sp.]|nr:family efflux transporter permease subunit [Subtercola sp.]
MSTNAHPRRQRNIALLVAGTFFMENLDGTILTTAAPSIGADFGVASLSIGVAITAYLLTLAVLIPLSGWLTQRFGARRIFLTAIAVFTLASILCALSQNLTELTIFRVLQGVGGALMVPVGRLAVLRITSKADLIRTVALLTWPALAAPVIAPLIGGILSTYASWHWIFLINVPLGLVAFVVAARILPRERRETPPPLDWLGLGLTSIGLGVLVYLGSLLAGAEQNAGELIVLAVVGLGLLALATAHFLRTSTPLLRLRSLRIETFRVSNAGGAVYRMTLFAVPFLLPLLFQDEFGYSPVLAGTLVLFVFIGNFAIKPATTPMLRRFGFRPVIVAATIGAALSMVLCAFLTRDTPFVVVAALLVFSGVARSTGFTAYNTIAFADVPQAEMTDANTLTSTLQQVAAGFGVAVGAVALRAGEAAWGGLGAFQFSFLVIGALTLVSTVEALRLSPNAGANIRPPAARGRVKRA